MWVTASVWGKKSAVASKIEEERRARLDFERRMAAQVEGVIHVGVDTPRLRPYTGLRKQPGGKESRS